MFTARMIMVAMFLIAGTLSAYAAIFNPEWFFRSPNVRILTGSLRRPIQRLIYGLLAAAMLFMAARLILSD